MHETDTEIERLQSLIDDSYRKAGDHLRSIHQDDCRMTARDVCTLLQGVCVLDLATVSLAGRPIVAPIDGLFLGGVFWFGSSRNSVRFRHIRQNPNVSAAFTQGEEISILVHGTAHEIDTASGEYERFHDYCREIYGPNYDEWGYWENEPFAWIEARRFYALDLRQR